MTAHLGAGEHDSHWRPPMRRESPGRARPPTAAQAVVEKLRALEDRRPRSCRVPKLDIEIKGVAIRTVSARVR
jgi:hypothetical protein